MPLTRVPEHYCFSARWRNCPNSPLISCDVVIFCQGSFLVPDTKVVGVQATSWKHIPRHIDMLSITAYSPPLLRIWTEKLLQPISVVFLNEPSSQKNHYYTITLSTNLTSHLAVVKLLNLMLTFVRISNKMPSHHIVRPPKFPHPFSKFYQQKTTKCLVAMLPPKPSPWPQRP